jgi:hypothetical protein
MRAVALWIALVFMATIGPAYAVDGPVGFLPDPDWIIFGLSLVLAAWWSVEAFDRPSIVLADVPTFPAI